MKKRMFNLLLVFFACIAVIGLVGLIFQKFTATETIYLSEDFCIIAWGCTTEEFFDLELDLYNETEDFRKNASISEDGDLILNLTQKQKDVWVSSLQQEISMAEEENNNIDILDDLYTIIIYSYKETVSDDLIEAFAISFRMRHVRFLSGIDNPTLPEYILKDGNTDEIIWNYSQQVGDIYDVDYIIDDLVQIVNEYYSAIESEND